MKLLKNIFREYDIRGVYGEELSDELAYHIGRAYGTNLVRKNIYKTVVAYDNRLSSESLEKNLTKGLVDCGVKVLRIGLATTPMCYFAANYLNTNSSMMITASHNPKEYNGFKFSYNGIHNAYGAEVMEIYNIITNSDYVDGKGSIENVDIREAYIDLVISKLNFGNRKIKVVYDCGNGTSSIIADDIFDKIKDKVDSIPLFNISDGNFPNHHPDPCVSENQKQLIDKVLEINADVGLGFDGDGDRCGVVDNKGNIIKTDTYMAIMSQQIILNNEDKRILYDVKCSDALRNEIIKWGGTPICYRTGASYTASKVKDDNILFGGEYSGHIYFNDRIPVIGSGIYAGLRMVEFLSKSDKPLSEYVESIDKYYSTDEIKFPSPNAIKNDVIDKIKKYCINMRFKIDETDGVKIIKNDGWALIRVSNTGPNITARFEASSEENLNKLQEEFIGQINKYNI
jgi:phosphomannomutase/phosphoglucomutase